MIQRIQTVYLSIAIVLLSIASIGPALFSYLTETSRFVFTAYSITEYSVESGEVLATRFFPLVIGTILLTLLCFATLMSYKNLKRQFKLGRMTFYLYFLMLIVVVLITGFGDRIIEAEKATRELGLAFMLFVAGFPFTFLANTGIKRDKKLLESLDRLR